ncbi:hypothetical protein [Streptomyces sp. NPDC001340]
MASVQIALAIGMAATASAADKKDGPDKPGQGTTTTYYGDPVNLTPGAHDTAWVQCPSGAAATGGGGITTGDDADATYLTDSHPTDSTGAPSTNGSTPTAWAVSATNNGNVVDSSTLQAYVVCEKKTK